MTHFHILPSIYPSNVLHVSSPLSPILTSLRLHVIFLSYPFFGYPQNSVIGSLLRKVMQEVKSFVQQTFSVTQSDITITQSTCADVTIPAANLNTPMQADFVVFVRTGVGQGFYANALACIFDTISNRPIVGRILWNSAQITQNIISQPFGYQLHIRIGLHELMHALGFSSSMFSNFASNPIITQGQIHYFSLSKVTALVNQHFGCANKGLPLQSGIGGSITSHWATDVLGDEIMTPVFQIGDQMFISSFTLALFEDSGFYTSISYKLSEQQFMTFGKGRGCSFVRQQNCSIRPEYCAVEGIVFYNLGTGVCAQTSFSACKARQLYSNRICRSETYPIVQDATLERSGWNSWAYSADIINPAYESLVTNRCYPTTCGLQGIYLTIKIGNKDYICTNGGIIKDSTLFTGQLACPSDVNNYCSSIMACDNFCGTDQMCVRGICLSKCPSNNYYNGTSCLMCPSQCQQCIGPSICISCPTGSNYRLNSLCITCPSVTTFDLTNLLCRCNQGQTCTECGRYCKTCTAGGCTACIPDYHLVGSQCKADGNCSLNQLVIGRLCIPCIDGLANSDTDQCVKCNQVEIWNFSTNLCVACPDGQQAKFNSCGGCFLLKNNGVCVANCPINKMIDANLTCSSCADEDCSQRLSMILVQMRAFKKLLVFKIVVKNANAPQYQDIKKVRDNVNFVIEQISGNQVIQIETQAQSGAATDDGFFVTAQLKEDIIQGNYNVSANIQNINEFGMSLSATEASQQFKIASDPSQGNSYRIGAMIVSVMVVAISFFYKARMGKYNAVMFTQMAALSIFTRQLISNDYFFLAQGLDFSNLNFYNPFLLLTSDYQQVSSQKLARFGHVSNPFFEAGGTIMFGTILCIASIIVYCFSNTIGKRFLLHLLSIMLTPLLFFSANMLQGLQYNLDVVGKIYYIIGLVVTGLSIILAILQPFISNRRSQETTSILQPRSVRLASETRFKQHQIDQQIQIDKTSQFGCCRSSQNTAEYILDGLRRVAYICVYIGAIYQPKVFDYGYIAVNGVFLLPTMLLLSWPESVLVLIEVCFGVGLTFGESGRWVYVMIVFPGLSGVWMVVTIVLTYFYHIFKMA